MAKPSDEIAARAYKPKGPRGGMKSSGAWLSRSWELCEARDLYDD